MSPLLKSTEKVGIRALRRKRNPVDISAADFFSESELLREEFARMINVKSPKQIVIIPSVSYGISTVARNIDIKRGEHIIVAAEQFPSNYYAWERLCQQTGATIKTIQPDDTRVGRGKKWNEKILDGISAHTKVVSIAHTHWADGTRFDLEAIRKRTREVNALMIIDGTQSVGALPFDVQRFQPDALICGGYKWLLGPYSIGVAYFSEQFNNGVPIEESWMNRLNSEDFSGLVRYEPQYQPGALRFEVGEHSNFVHVPMLLDSIRQLNRWHVHNVQEYAGSISQKAIASLQEKGCWVEDAAFRGNHLIGLRLPKGTNIDKAKAALLKNRVYVSFRGDAIRVAVNVYNTERDLLKFVKVLSSAF